MTRATPRIDLYRVLLAVTLRNELAWLYLVHKDVTQMIIDQSAQSWGGKYNSNVARSFVPLYLIVLLWAGKGYTTSTAALLRDTCKCDNGGSIVPIGDFIHNWAEPNGPKKVLNQIRAEKRSFRGRKIFIAPSRKNYGTWESKWRNVIKHFSFRAAHASSDHAYASLFHSFVHIHCYGEQEEAKNGNYI